ncbi:hypothetical protein PYW08_002549 [Mythimna loreyi]|uniref:Uncharacterized protein n=1 Tax=Mythimna loreyi TaxID=667449 RepID=A0ACC2QJE1_9NEOP|nr:hypothetical protein PYW08_002549 [Mythimna loreyi]
MDVSSLKETHPQKYYFKALCRLMFYLGMGDLWYEKTEVPYYKKRIYAAWMIVANGFVIIILFDELLSYARTDLTDREKNDLVQFTFAHPLIYCKVLTLYIWKGRIKVVMERLLEGSRPIFHSMELEKMSVKQFAKNCFILTAVSYVTLGAATIEAIRLHFIEDIPVRTEVVYFPNSSQTGFFINVLRFFKEFHWYYIVAMMATMDCLALCSLITVAHKFRVLRLYFHQLGIRTLENKEHKTRKELAEEFKKDFVIGIKLHSDALWCARNVQQSMGPLYSIQVMESVALLVMSLIKLVASLVGTAMFHSGWEVCCPGPDLRVLVVVALQMSQVPVYMTAFGVITLSHTNLISKLIGMDVPSLKQTHPQKHYFKSLCRLMFYLGMGDLWYEKTEVSYYTKKIYAAWMILANGFVIVILFDELLSFARTDLTDREKNDLVQFSFAHPLIYGKVVTLYIWKSRIKVVMERLLEGSRPIFHSLELEKMSVKQYVKNCFALTAVCYVTLGTSTIEAIRLHFIEGIPVRTEVVYFPNSSQTGFFINVLRFFKEFHWYYIVAMMATMDCLVLCSLITVGHKFRVLSLYFQQLGIRISENKEQKTRKKLAEEFKKDFVVGIKLHSDALWCARNVQHSMGPLYSIQVMESVALLVMCLVKLVVAERNVTYLLATSAYIFCLIVLTGSYMMVAGDITHEASLVGTAMFHSGWEECRPGPDLRVLVVVALQMSQVPVYMTAFGVITLAHTNFISVLRSSYSFFAVMY